MQRGWLAAGCASLVSLSAVGWGQSLDYASAMFRSAGGNAGTDWNLWSNGYAGTFIHLDSPGTVQLTVNAAGQQAAGAWPNMDLYVGSQKFSYSVNQTTFENYTASVNLPAGTHLVRTEFDNDYYAGGEDRNLLLRNLSFSAPGTGLQVVNPTTAAETRQAAFAASDSYIENYRKGNAAVTLMQNGAPLPAGTAVHVKLNRHEFNFGTAVAGASPWGAWPITPNPVPGSDAAKYQEVLASHFNMVVQENAGKWGLTEETRGTTTMEYSDAILQFAKDHNMRARFHNVAWGQQQPDWVTALETAAKGGDAAAAADLRNAISNRINYVAGDPARARSYVELDGINESYHEGVYRDLYGDAGVASIYNEAINAVRSSGSDAKVYFNEYSVLNAGAEAYGSWYRAHMQGIIDAGITPENRQRLGIGSQYYTSAGDHDPVQVYRTLNNLTSMDMPVTLTEFGVQDGDTAAAPQILADSLRMTFGTEGTTGLLVWGYWKSNMWMKGAALYDENWNLTEAGKVWEQMMGIHDWGLADVPTWTTDLTLLTDANGQIGFRGFYGDYSLEVDGTSYGMTLARGQEGYTVQVPEPTGLAGLVTAGWLLTRRRSR